MQVSRNANLCHEAKIQDADLAFRGADEVAWVGIGMQEACLQQLDEVAVEQRGAQLPHIPCCALAQLLACTHNPSVHASHSHSPTIAAQVGATAFQPLGSTSNT